MSKILVIDPRPGPRARLTALLDELGAVYEVLAMPSQVLSELQAGSVQGLVVAPQLTSLTGPGLLALARAVRPNLETLIVDQPEKDRDRVENLVARVGSGP